MKFIDETKRFYKGNLHAHSTNSDGRHTPDEVKREFKENGYDFLALTDHWKVGAEENFDGMLVIPGVEYDFTFDTQVLHIVSLFRNRSDSEDIVRGMDHMKVIRKINQRSGAVITAHPAWSLNTTEFLMSLDGVTMAEVYNTLSGEPINGPRADSASILDIAAANGKYFNFIASDDCHFYVGEQCKSYIMLQADELTVPAVIDALNAGHFYATQGPEFYSVERIGDELHVKTSPVSRCTFCSNSYWVNGRCHTGDGLTEAVHKIQPNEKFVRCQLTDAEGRLAWTSPIPIQR